MASKIVSFPHHVVSPSLNIDDLQDRLRVFTRLASSLRNQPVRREDQIHVIELEIDQLRLRLGYAQSTLILDAVKESQS